MLEVKMPQTVTVQVYQINEWNDVYYLAKSEDVPWFLCEWNSLDEITELTPGVLTNLLKTRVKRQNSEIKEITRIIFEQIITKKFHTSTFNLCCA